MSLLAGRMATENRGTRAFYVPVMRSFPDVKLDVG